MSGIQPQHRDRAPGSSDRWILLAAGCLALAPFVAYHRLFGRLYWFGDEFDLIDQIDRIGFWRWIWLVFAANFVPVFKLLWGVVLGDGRDGVADPRPECRAPRTGDAHVRPVLGRRDLRAGRLRAFACQHRDPCLDRPMVGRAFGDLHAPGVRRLFSRAIGAGVVRLVRRERAVLLPRGARGAPARAWEPLAGPRPAGGAPQL